MLPDFGDGECRLPLRVFVDGAARGPVSCSCHRSHGMHEQDQSGANQGSRMFKKKIVVLLAVAMATAGTALAALKTGEVAPDFKTQASIGGKVFTFALSETLKKGPVVLYFYPAAFTKGCTIEAHDFAEAVDAYAALGATVIGVSRDDIDTLNKFSVSECRGKFAVAADQDQKIMKSYDAVLAAKPSLADRTSYVISPDARIVYSFTSLNPEKHVENTLDALRKWSAQQKR